jgi:hypothetical protein
LIGTNILFDANIQWQPRAWSNHFLRRKRRPILPKAKKLTPAANGKKSSEPKEVSCGAPDEPIDGGWPPGWTKRTFERKSGASKRHTDRYWYTPQKEYKLRSMVEVKRFMAFVKDTNGDEELPWEYFKGRR